MRFQPAWYILLYHDVSWEENEYLKGLGGVCPPNTFAEHVQELTRIGELVDIRLGYEKYFEGTIDKPIFSFWFDDGFLGVRKYALPVLNSYGVNAAISINSDFMLGSDMFWRAKLSFINQVDGMRFLRSRLRKLGYNNKETVRSFVLDHFSLEIVHEIDQIYNRFAGSSAKEDIFLLYDNAAGINTLKDHLWEIANHTASHFPVGESTYISKFDDEFSTCNDVIEQKIGSRSDFWVVPFERKDKRDKYLWQVFNLSCPENEKLVLVGNRANVNSVSNKRIIHRVNSPIVRGEDFLCELKGLLRKPY
jgi:peptidoglycan/xylan/chitin deacetylase (PgdA/CDA1 family)